MPYLKKVIPSPEPVDCRILTAALDLFVNRGFHNVSVHDVQKQADVSIGSIYNHFGGKEGIAKALYEHLLIEMQDLVDRAVQQIFIVADNQNCVWVTNQIAFKPDGTLKVQIVCRLIEQQEIRLREQYSSQSHTHLPTAREIGT